MIQKTFGIVSLLVILTGLFFVVPTAQAQFKNTPPQLQVKKDGSQTLIDKFAEPQSVECPPGYPEEYRKPGEKQCVAITWIADYIVALYRWLVSIVGILAVAMGVWAGIKWMAAAGNPEQINSAKTQIMNAVIGILLLLGSYVFLNTVNPELVKLKGIIIPGVTRKDLIKAAEAPCSGAINQYCGKQVNGTTGSICFSPYDDRGRYFAYKSSGYKDCCGSTGCCMGTTCTNAFETCVSGDVDSAKCAKGLLAGSIACDDQNSYVDKEVKLYALCENAHGYVYQVPTNAITSATACINGTQTWSLVPDVGTLSKLTDKDTLCPGADIKGYFLAMNININPAKATWKHFVTLGIGFVSYLDDWLDLRGERHFWFAVGKDGKAFTRSALSGISKDEIGKKAEGEILINQDNISTYWKEEKDGKNTWIPQIISKNDLNKGTPIYVNLK